MAYRRSQVSKLLNSLSVSLLLFSLAQPAFSERGCDPDLTKFRPLGNDPSLSEIEDSYAQLHLISTGLSALITPLSYLLSNQRAYPAPAILSYLEKNPDLMAKVYETARELQCGVEAYQGAVGTISASLSKLAQTVGPESQSDDPALIKGNDPQVRSAMASLSPFYSTEKVFNMMGNLIDVAAGIDTQELDKMAKNLYNDVRTKPQH